MHFERIFVAYIVQDLHISLHIYGAVIRTYHRPDFFVDVCVLLSLHGATAEGGG